MPEGSVAHRAGARMCVVFALVACLAACTEGAPRRPDPSFSPQRQPEVVGFNDDPSRPYVVTAIDYHFHDAHPSLPIAPDRRLIVRNQGANTHNVSFPGTDFSENIKPGADVVIVEPGRLLGGPGRYRLVCVLHADRGMFGTVVIED
ncbi:MAG: hypothetical protein WEA10_06830 [Actinomycetota bacterium]